MDRDVGLQMVHDVKLPPHRPQIAQFGFPCARIAIAPLMRASRAAKNVMLCFMLGKINQRPCRLAKRICRNLLKDRILAAKQIV